MVTIIVVNGHGLVGWAFFAAVSDIELGKWSAEKALGKLPVRTMISRMM